MVRKKKSIRGVDPEFLDRQKAALLRTHRQVLLFNDHEQEAIDEYCRRFGIRSRSSLLREAIMEKVLAELDEHHPTLF